MEKKRKNRTGSIQRYLCRDCGYRFSEVSFSTSSHIHVDRQVCVTADGAKNLIVANEEKLATGEISENDTILKELEYWHNINGKAETTRDTRIRRLRTLSNQGVHLSKPTEVQEAVRNQKWMNSTRNTVLDAYKIVANEILGLNWIKPVYLKVETPIFIPLESEIDALIAGTGPKTSVFLQVLKETGARRSEAHALHWKDIDFESKLIRITPEKGSKARVIPISNELLNRLAKVKATNRVQDPERIWSKKVRTVARVFYNQRKNVAEKLQNPRIKKITFHTLRHWKGTMLYHETKDIRFVKRFLGHRNILNTEHYIHLEEAYFQDTEEEYVTKVAEDIDEAIPLIEAGFELAAEYGEAKIFKKKITQWYR